MASGLPLKEVKVLLNKPGMELDERLAKCKQLGATGTGGYLVELDGNLKKGADGELEFSGSVHTIALPADPVGGEISGGYSRRWARQGTGDVYMSFWFEATL